MGARRRHAVEREPAQPRARAVLRRAPDQDTGMLGLQRSAGNRAVAEQLQVARGDAAPMDTETKKGSATLTLDGIGSFEIDGYGWGVSSPGAGGGGGGKTELTKITVTARSSKLGKAITSLMDAAAHGRRIDNAELAQGSVVLHMHDVYITDVQTGGDKDDPTISFTLDFGSLDYGRGDKSKPGEVEPGGEPKWDPGQGKGV